LQYLLSHLLSHRHYTRTIGGLGCVVLLRLCGSRPSWRARYFSFQREWRARLISGSRSHSKAAMAFSTFSSSRKLRQFRPCSFSPTGWVYDICLNAHNGATDCPAKPGAPNLYGGTRLQLSLPAGGSVEFHVSWPDLREISNFNRLVDGHSWGKLLRRHHLFN
jgi:hypothetical protein